jgi:hypothetical protein
MPNTPANATNRAKADKAAQRELDAYYRTYEAKLDMLLEEVESHNDAYFAQNGRMAADY